MIVGLGNDIVEINRFDLKLVDRILTDIEKENKKLNAQYLAGRFSLKESFFKAIGTGISNNSFKDISFLNNKNGKPYFVMHKDFKGFNFCHIALSHDKFANSMVVLEKIKGKIFLGLGSNIGNREENLKKALEYIENFGINILRVSSIYITKPYGYLEQDDFFNIAVEVDTDLSPFELLNTIMEIERIMKRKREIKWGPRNIDIDILFYGNLVVENENLKIPHYDFKNRDFFIAPMYEIAKDFVDPIFDMSMNEYYSKLEKNWEVINWQMKKL
ncbi:2-amino-4-hydroxy-6-hydroxymethyldihydropteridine pyrophosphokinase [Thermosipho africanus H17ap60334]|uniref:2-amino-4-hydroxy-6- hydroxymethyldihydropteridine diphosphokinase n=1 Tax=Thermosipho africanus TaxID=2421 RepID=UPI00028D8DCF|nr:2-amino-4-hydroxy-6-hydroxymethyldihydropteridine diphosphokinase [Thermosipho africanus]EKF48902.1 2-amino-4-hydroxy-6-hydroxymethyldihydropteridine pyrophosphokinase [Thermosipho africanus H17ap60334]MDK2840038.1 2-amino-4-hydroxy-6-hydroxymethyldihydropteridine diphosphokinase [Thermosipho sp. (in: thermotogales)]MDK2900659.1 2-amino-4-hydroxy-6-hydroxymethyldihydropteridine diphosphokinase [Thermosipho sp. (in: thermotogales)]RDI92823.1 bifunctional 4'-phosphopantetheinyl transferase/7,8